MKTQQRFIDHYKNDYTPWAHEKVDFNLVEVVENWPIKTCKTLEAGCGLGTDSIWLAQQGFDVTSIDLSPLAIEKATANAKKYNAKINFRVFDLLNQEITESEYEFVFDRGFFHTFDEVSERDEIAKRISKCLVKNGLWLSLIGSADGVRKEPGPPMRSATEIIQAVEPYFKIISLQVSQFGSDQVNPAKIWVCLLRKRN